MAGSAARVARKRNLAREAGLCTICFKTPPDAGRSVCPSCIAAAAERVARRRREKRTAEQLERLSQAHERAGDEAYARHLHTDAASQYEDALNLAPLESADRLRITEKLANAHALGRNPRAAIPLLDSILSSHSRHPADPAKTVDILLRRARHLSFEGRIKEAAALSTHAIHIAKEVPDRRLYVLANGMMANLLIALGQYEEAESLYNELGNSPGTDDPSARVLYYRTCASVAATRGSALEAFDHFENALRIAKDETDPYQVVRTWNIYGTWAATLGNIELARSCCERALFVARQCRALWLIAEINLEYAEILRLSGRYGLALEHLLEALSYDAESAILDTTLVEVGIPLCLHMNDEQTLEKCARHSAIDTAFRSGLPSRIGPVAAAFATLFAARDKKREAQSLLHRALQNLKIAQTWDLPIAVARFGANRDIEPARAMLAQFAVRPSSNVAQACLPLFDAFVASRRDETAAMNQHAADAAKRLDTLGFYAYSDLARSLLPSQKASVVADRRAGTASGILAGLTSREQEVAQLVLRGLTNREIAQQLEISKHTVESHVASIMGRLGIRSRYQLADAIPVSDTVTGG